MKKKFLAVLLAGAMVLGVTACGSLLCLQPPNNHYTAEP